MSYLDQFYTIDDFMPNTQNDTMFQRLSSVLLLLLFINFNTSAVDSPEYMGRVFESSFIDILSGNAVSIGPGSSVSRGVLVVFWNSSCGPCLAEIPELNSLYSKWQSQGVQIIGFPQDQRQDELVTVCRRFGITWPQNFEPGPAFEKPSALAWQVERTPYFFLLDRNGRILSHGFQDPAAALDELLN